MLTLALATLAVVAAPAEDTYHWPLDLPRVLTSSFGEYRAGRFHMGIDLRTGPIGKEVHAAADGYVSRIACSPYGYGKVVYVALADGYTAVYAHLDDFAPDLRAYVQAAQHRREEYSVDLYPARNRFPVKRGEVIASSGQTGIGVPHLHYEIRDPAGVPVSPRQRGVAWPDTTAPVIRKVLVFPVTPESTVNGDYLPVVIVPRPGRALPALAVRGKVAFGLDLIDPANGGSSKLGVRTVKTTSGGEEIFVMHHDRVSYDHDENGAVAYHPFLLGQGRFLLQWRWPGNRTELYSHSARSGDFAAPETSAEVEFSVEDFYGNETSLILPVTNAETVLDSTAVSGRDGVGAVDIACFGDWLVITARFTADEESVPELHVESFTISVKPFERIGPRLFRATYLPRAGTKEAVLSVVHPRVNAERRHYAVVRRGEGPRRLTLGALEVSAETHSPYSTLFLSVEEKEARTTGTLEARGNAYAFRHGTMPLEVPLSISFPIPGDVGDLSRLLVYRKRGPGWSMEGGEVQNGRIVFDANALGTFALFEDRTPPLVRAVRPAEGAALLSKRPPIHARVQDSGSGIREYSIRFRGKWLLAAYDPEREFLEWERDEDLPSGPGELVFRITDHAGNVTHRALRITVPD